MSTTSTFAHLSNEMYTFEKNSTESPPNYSLPKMDMKLISAILLVVLIVLAFLVLVTMCCRSSASAFNFSNDEGDDREPVSI